MFYSYFDHLCKQKGVSKSKACLDMGLSRSVASKWKSTDTQPSMDTLIKIAEYFDVSIDECLLHSKNEPTILDAAAISFLSVHPEASKKTTDILADAGLSEKLIQLLNLGSQMTDAELSVLLATGRAQIDNRNTQDGQ